MAERVVKLNFRRHWFAWLLLLSLVVVAACSQIFRWSYKVAVPVAAGILLVWLLIAGIYLFLRFLVYLARRRRWIALAAIVGVSLWLLSFPRDCYLQWRAAKAILNAGGSLQCAGDYGPTDMRYRGDGIPGREAIERITDARIPANKHPDLRYYVGCLGDLKTLDLSVRTGDDAFGIKKLRRLKELRLHVDHNPDAALAFVRRLDRLEQLWVSSNEHVTDDGLRNLAGLRCLEDLDFRSPAITDSGIDALQLLPLKFVVLSECSITDVGLRKMHQMPLISLRVNKTQVTTTGLQAMRAANSGVIIEPAGVADAPEEAEAVKKLEQRGFSVTPDQTGHVILVYQWGDRSKVSKEFLEHEPDFDETCTLFAQLQNLQTLVLERQTASLAGLKKIATLKQLQTLRLIECKLTDEQLAPLSDLTQLRELTITQSPITDAGLEPLSKLANLEECTLTETQVKGHTLDQWAVLQKLARLNLMLCPFDDEGLLKVSKIRCLEKLDLQATKITDAGLKHLTSLPNLTNLVLDETKVTDAGLPALINCKSLRTLSFFGTRITERATDKLGETTIVPWGPR